MEIFYEKTYIYFDPPPPECGSRCRGLETGGDERNFGRGRRCGFAASGTRPAPLCGERAPNIPRQPLIGNPEHYDSDIAEFPQRVENGAMSPDCNSFNAEYSKRETEDTKYLSTTGAEYGYRDLEPQNGCHAATRANRQAIKPNRHGAFTLAEVLITLSIIGVVAALTIPGLVAKKQEKETVVQLKKAYNVLNNAFMFARQEYGSINNWQWDTDGSLSGSINIMNNVTPYLNIMKRCDGTKGCYPKNVTYLYLNGAQYNILDDMNWRSKAMLADGMIFSIHSNGGCTHPFTVSGDKKYCGGLHIDVNGNKAPNQYGKDSFIFWISEEGIIPSGLPDATVYSLSTNCKNSDGNGCTGWVLLKENLNYPEQEVGWN